ncbi:hypothetical protein Tco_0650863 [Tanacetum coccineum]
MEVNSASAPVTTAGVSVSTAELSTPPPPPTTTTNLIEDEDLTIAQTLMKMKSEKSKAKGLTMQEPSKSGTRVRVPPPQIDPKDKGNAKMVEPEKPKKKKDQIQYDADVLAAGSSKRDAEEELDQESSKRQKTVPEQGMNVEALQTKYLIIDWEIYTKGTRKYWNIIRIGNLTERKGIDIYMLVEKEYPLSRGTLTLRGSATLLVDLRYIEIPETIL